jgi:membrane-associated phospholipid phosphatase
MTMQPEVHWDLITRLGAAGLMLPMLLMVCAALWQTGQWGAAGRWLLLVIAGAVLVLGTKIAFLAWGLGSAALDFTGISGHTTLATAILPVWLGWMLARGRCRIHPVGMLAGLALGALVGWSRVELGAHSPSESVAGWLLGALIAYFAFRSLDRRVSPPWLARSAGLILLLAMSPTLSTYLPTHDWERQVALVLSADGVLHERASLEVGSRG